MMSISQLREVAAQVAAWSHGFEPIDWSKYTPDATYLYEGEIAPKERPRRGKNGTFYTPATTKRVEKAVGLWGRKQEFKPVTYPLSVSIMILEQTNDETLTLHSAAGVYYNQKGDVDNFGKLICDALNKIAYRDDKQIVDLNVCRQWSNISGFRMTMRRAGLNKSEYTILRKMLP